MAKITSVDQYIDQLKCWKEEAEFLRRILLKTQLLEEVKWSAPCYTYHGKNIVGIAAFKAYFGLWFFQGALLKDANLHLINAQEEKTHAMRQWRFQHIKDIKTSIIEEYILESKAMIDKGIKIKTNSRPELVLPTELVDALKIDNEFAVAWENQSYACRKEYTLYISEAKKVETRYNRVTKCKEMVLTKKGRS